MTANKLLIAIFALSMLGCADKNTDKNTDKRVEEAKARYAELNAPEREVSPMLRLECSTQVGTKMTAVMDGGSQTVIIKGAVFRFVDRDDTRGTDTLVFERSVNGITSWVFVNMGSVDTVRLAILRQKTLLKFTCSAFGE